MSAPRVASSPRDSAGSTWPCDCFLTYPKRRRSSLDSVDGAGPGKAIRVQLEAPRPSPSLLSGRLSGHGLGQARVSGGSACPGFPEPSRIGAVIGVSAYCPVDPLLVRIAYIIRLSRGKVRRLFDDRQE